MYSTIQVSSKLKKEMDAKKLYAREPYNEVLGRLMEDSEELDAKTKSEIERSMREIRAGKFKTHAQLGKELGF